MNSITVLKKIVGIISDPVDILTDWAREPLKRWEHKRNQDALDKTLQRELEAKTYEKKLDSELRTKEAEQSAIMDVYRQTEVIRIVAEIEEVKKDKHIERMKATSDAIRKYQQELVRINTDAIQSIGMMQLDLRAKAQNMVLEKTMKYKELQDIAINDAINDMTRIDAITDERQKDILIKAVDKRLANIIDTANNFLAELSNDIRLINHNITLLSSSGQSFIQRHLEQFHVLGFGDAQLKLLEGSQGSNNPEQ